MVRLGSIHGRFQPFHNGHLGYALAALQHAERIYVGLTRALPPTTNIGATTAPHRSESANNPLSYFERTHAVSAALLGAGVPRDRFDIGPFPIEDVLRLPEFWPLNALCFTTVVDDWNREKITVLSAAGYEVRILSNVTEGLSTASGTEIRAMIRAGDRRWRDFVPSGAIGVVERYIDRFS